MLLLTAGTTMKFPLTVKMETAKQNKNEVSLAAGELALTLVNGKQTTAISLHHVPYAPAGINYAQTNGDVLSGIFSGCVMSIYKVGGIRRVAHVHTGDDAGAGLDCKDTMKALLNAPNNSEQFSFKPFRRSDDTLAISIATKTKFGASGCATFGYVTAGNICYSLFTRKVSAHEYVIESVVKRTDGFIFG